VVLAVAVFTAGGCGCGATVNTVARVRASSRTSSDAESALAYTCVDRFIYIYSESVEESDSRAGIASSDVVRARAAHAHQWEESEFAHIYTHIHVYVRIYVRTYVCVYIKTIQIFVWMDALAGEFKDGWVVDIDIDRQIDG
jgi:hypothetical protein